VALAATLLLLSLALAAIAAVDAARRQHRIAPERPRWFRSTWAAAAAVVLFGLLTDQALPFGWQSFYIPSGSMMPTLLVGDRFLADIRHPGAMPARGDIVLFVPPSEPGATYIKRVIGLPGDRIALHHGILFINGTALPRQPIAETAAAAMPGRLYAETLPGGRCYTILHQTDSGSANNTPDYAVPASSLFVMGDNRDNSTDSRFSQVGFVPLNTVQGTAGSLFWSPDRTRLFTRIE
jgi:signal peptidase I